ncbi:MAG: ABC transporter permease, partial [Blastocatellia bacterium]|nr:ABC transporter permease [Blastocatellia bacterium]
LGIGANTAIFSVAHAVMWRSLPYQQPERLVMVWERMTWEKQTQPSPNEPALFLAWRESKEVFLDVAAYEDAAISHRSRFFLTGGNEPERIMGAYVSGNLFSMLGVNAALGRIFTIEDEQPGRGQVVILSDGFWRRRFGADPDVIGKTIRSRLAPAIRRAVWAEDKDLPLEEVATMEQITADATADSRFISIALGVFASIALLLGATGIYGVISCSVAERTREIGVRMALGAERFDVLRLVLAQGMKLALIGVALGLIAAFGLTRLMKSLLFGVSATDPLTFAAIAALLVLVAALACWIPARRATKVDPMVALRCD